MNIRRISEFESEYVADLNKLILQLSPDKKLTENQLKLMVRDKNVFLLGLFDKKRIVGTASLIILNQIVGSKASIEDVVVDEAYRGQGWGEKLMREILKIAQELKMRKVVLTSMPDRIAAHKLYEKLGFTIKETDVLHLKF